MFKLCSLPRTQDNILLVLRRAALQPAGRPAERVQDDLYGHFTEGWRVEEGRARDLREDARLHQVGRCRREEMFELATTLGVVDGVDEDQFDLR